MTPKAPAPSLRVRFGFLAVVVIATALVAHALLHDPQYRDPHGGWAFETCEGAYNAGQWPVYRSDPESGYHELLDPDGDGVACENGPDGTDA